MTRDERPLAATTDLRLGDRGETVVRSALGMLLCLGCRRARECRLGLSQEELRDDGSVLTKLACPVEQEGGPGVAHGGWTAAAFDEMVGHTMLLRNEFVVTRALHVEFVKPVPIRQPLIARTWIVSREGRDVEVRSEMRLEASGALLGSATGHMVRRPAEHYDWNDAWLREQGIDKAAD